MKTKIPDTKGIVKTLNSILKQGVDGVGPLSSSEKLAQEYLKDRSYRDMDDRVRALIRWEASKNFGTGFLTGLGGIVTLPVSIPASMYASWVVQARMAGAIAVLYGYSTKEDRVRTFILLSILGDAGKEVVKEAGITITNKIVMNAVSGIPAQALLDINRRIGMRLFTRSGTDGVINLSKLVPVVGGFVGGIVDTATCVIVGKTAQRIFMPEKYREYAVNRLQGHDFNLRFDGDQLSRLVTSNVDMVNAIEMPEDGVLKVDVQKVPMSIQYRILSYEEGEIRLKPDGNIFKKGFLNLALGTRLRDLPYDLRDVISFKDGVISIDINEILRRQDEVQGVLIDSIVIKKNELRIRLG